MNLKITLITLLILAIIVYAIGLIGDPLIFLVFLIIASLIILFEIFLLATNLILKFIPPRLRKIYEIHKMRFKIIILVCIIFFLFAGWTINHYCLPDILHPISLLSNGGILLFAIFLVWVLIKQIKKRILVAGISIFILFFVLITLFNSITYKDIESYSTEALKSLPYLRWIPAEKTINKTGVTKYDQRQSFKGLNLYASRNNSIAYIIDMTENILHKWSAKINKEDTWQHIEMCENGDLLAIVKDKYLIRLDWDSNVKWVKKIRVHHDIAIAENKDIYILARKDKVVLRHGLPLPILADYVVVLSSDGKIKKEIPLYKILKREISFGKFINIYLNVFIHHVLNPEYLIGMLKRKAQYIFDSGTAFDIFHNNTVEIINRDIEGLCKKGDLLFSARELNLIGIINIKKENIIWKWGQGNLIKQHHPTLLENGNILIFDNGCGRKYSRIIEIEPFTKKNIWEYKSNPPKEFFSNLRGWVQRLPNGNTLITESDKGRVFEVKKDGTNVWEFFNPEIKKIEKTRAAIYSMTRITDLDNYSKLKELIQ